MHPSWCAVARECLACARTRWIEAGPMLVMPTVPTIRARQRHERRSCIHNELKCFRRCANTHVCCEVAQCVQVAFEAPSIAQPQTPPRTGLRIDRWTDEPQRRHSRRHGGRQQSHAVQLPRVVAAATSDRQSSGCTNQDKAVLSGVSSHRPTSIPTGR